MQNGQDGDITFHFNPRLETENDCNIIVCNSCVGGWGEEVRFEEFFPFNNGEATDVLIRCEQEEWVVYANGQRIANFLHRIPFTEVDTVKISGEVQVNSFAIQ